MRVAIVQSNYIPWKGYFDLIASVDHFVLYDEVQYTRRDWRNRNRIKTTGGVRWLTIPVQTKGAYTQRIDETRIADPGWARSHWSTIQQAYRDAPAFAETTALLAPQYERFADDLLSDVNEALLRCICEQLQITTAISRSTDHPGVTGRSERLLSICSAVGASEYVSGPAARAYIDVDLFARAGVDVEWFDYSGYREYPQLHGAFVHEVSVIDLLFNTGPRSREWLLAGVCA
ncbi:MAG TPA: WbqC family protein [Solirubrobacteraceae bacterium]